MPPARLRLNERVLDAFRPHVDVDLECRQATKLLADLVGTQIGLGHLFIGDQAALGVIHHDHDDSPLTTISTEFIPFPDYGGGGKYSIFENSVACAQWLRQTWARTTQTDSGDAVV